MRSAGVMHIVRISVVHGMKKVHPRPSHISFMLIIISLTSRIQKREKKNPSVYNASLNLLLSVAVHSDPSLCSHVAECFTFFVE